MNQYPCIVTDIGSNDLVIGPEQRAEISAAIDKAKLNRIHYPADDYSDDYSEALNKSSPPVDLGIYSALFVVVEYRDTIFRHLAVFNSASVPDQGPSPEIVAIVMAEFGFHGAVRRK